MSDAPRPRVFAESTWRGLADVPVEVAVLACGATEPHNHLAAADPATLYDASDE